MPTHGSVDNEALRRLMRRVWRDDVAPLLRDKRAAQRRKTARFGGKLAVATGLLVDGALRLKGKPFTRFMTVVGTSFGAMLPDVWDWKWLSAAADDEERELVAKQVRKRAAQLPEAGALELFGLDAGASRDDLKNRWRRVLKRWHPDKAENDRQRAEFHIRFLAYQAAYDRLCRAYEEKRLPVRSQKPD